MKRLFVAVLVLGLVLGLFACAGATQEFDMEAFFETVRGINDPQSAADLLLQGHGLGGYRGTIPDEALLTYEQLLRRMAGELSLGDNIPRLFRRAGNEFRVNYAVLLEQLNANEQLSPRAEAWLGLLADEDSDPTIANGAIQINRNHLLMRMLAWENFEHDYRNFAQALRGMGHFSAEYSQTLMRLFLLGNENSPIYNLDGALRRDAREAFDAFLHAGHGHQSIYLEVILDAYNIWSANAWQYNENVRGALTAISQRNVAASPPPGFPGLSAPGHPFGGIHSGECC